LTPANIVRNAKRVRLTRIKASIDIDDKGEHKYFTANAVALDGIRHVTIRLYTKKGEKIRADGRMGPNNNCWVHCDCPYFQYYVEVALTARGASSVLTSNGSFPKIRNPSMRPYLCKHLYSAGLVAPKTKAKRRRVTQIDELELDQLVKLLEPFVPRK